MGKRSGSKFHKKHQQHGQKKQKKEWVSPNIPEENYLFKAYYQLQLDLPHQEFQIFWQTMKEKLPVVFRVNPSCPNYCHFLKKISDEKFIENIIKKEEMGQEEKEKVKMQCLNWYPHNIVYQINTNKQEFKKNAGFNELHKYLQKSFDSGLIARQELVSMLPPLYLDVKKDDIVLDMCAAPGSKTSQLLEMIYGQDKGEAKGCVIANDADYSRAQMLIHQINRSGTSGMAVINHPGQFLPELYAGKIHNVKQRFQFDKILCDVPCSGDGATRKIPIKWAKWHTSDGQALHPLQLSILMKSINLLKRGGLLVYSTCSLNPMQNEAVLSALFQKINKGLQIIDIHPMYDIKGRKGLLSWKVCGVQYKIQKQEIDADGVKKEIKKRELKIYQNYEEVKHLYKIKPSMFPPSQEQALKMQLHHSMRLLPHDQNSGGFFVALIKKHQDFEWKYQKNKVQEKNHINNLFKEFDQDEQLANKQKMEQEFVDQNLPEVENPVAFEDDPHGNQREKQGQSEDQESNEEDEKEENKQIQNQNEEKEMKEKNNKKQQNPFKKKKGAKYEKFQNLDVNQFQNIRNYYGLSEELKDFLFVRDAGNNKRKVLLISEGVKKFLQSDVDKKIKLVNMGCKVFEKGKQSFAGYECLYRLCQEGIHFILPLIKKRKVKVSVQFFRSVLSIQSLLHEKIEEVEVKQQIKAMSQGSFCIYVDQMIEGKHVIDAMVGQNFKNSLHLMVGKEELASLNLRYL